ncbi:MAG: TatD family hydrolase [Cyclobacteriaceae bacterium]|tara:strand:- start:421 stop:1194 length:774 start_codon:yes stop_codon:yes gene_type:complete
MQLADSHAHIYLEQFDEDQEDVIARAQEAAIHKIYMPNIDHTSIDRMLETAAKYPGYCIPMMGLHPCSVDKKFEKELYIVEEWLSKSDQFVAVGEIGTDLYWDKTFFDQQKEAFRIQCDLAIKHDFPIVIHCRESLDENIELVEEFGGKGLRGVFHCFSGTIEQAKKIIDLGFYLGIGGVATFKNGGLVELLPEIPLESIVLETDSPYLAPTPLRGKRNEPSFITHVAEKIAHAKDQDIEKIGEIATRNTATLFKGH